MPGPAAALPAIISAVGSIGGGIAGRSKGGGGGGFSIGGGDQFNSFSNQASNWQNQQYGGSSDQMARLRKQRKGQKEMFRDLVGTKTGKNQYEGGLMDQAMPEVGSVEEMLAGFTPDTLSGFQGVRDAGGYLSGDVADRLKDFQGKGVDVGDTYDMTKGYAEDVISGKYLNPETNDALRNYMDVNYKKTLGGVNALANKYGAFGGSDWANARQRAGNEIAAGVYQGERDRQQGAAGTFLPMLQGYKQNIKAAAGADLDAGRQQYYDLLGQAGQLQGIGSQQQQQRQQELDANRYLLKYPTQEARDRLGWASGILGGNYGQASSNQGWNSGQGGSANWGWNQTRQSPNISKSSGGGK